MGFISRRSRARRPEITRYQGREKDGEVNFASVLLLFGYHINGVIIFSDVGLLKLLVFMHDIHLQVETYLFQSPQIGPQTTIVGVQENHCLLQSSTCSNLITCQAEQPDLFLLIQGTITCTESSVKVCNVILLSGKDMQHSMETNVQSLQGRRKSVET